MKKYTPLTSFQKTSACAKPKEFETFFRFGSGSGKKDSVPSYVRASFSGPCDRIVSFALPFGTPHRASADSTSPPSQSFDGREGQFQKEGGMKKKQKKLVDMEGFVTHNLSNGKFRLKLENGVEVIGHLSGKIRQNRIKIVVGDKVTVELSPYDLTKGRITYRHS
jgi:translation initiation factor IF-1